MFVDDFEFDESTLKTSLVNLMLISLAQVLTFVRTFGGFLLSLKPTCLIMKLPKAIKDIFIFNNNKTQ